MSWWWVERTTATHHLISLQLRWETTRRHPYYLLFWRYARPEFQPEDEWDELFREIAPEVLARLLGVNGVYPDPADVELPEADSARFAAWRSGAAMQPQNGAIAAMLAFGLSPESLRYVGERLIEVSEIERPDERMLRAAARFRHDGPPELGNMVAGPVLSFQIRAPQSAIDEAVREFVTQWRAEAGIQEQRRRDSSVPDYLRVWDLREGWTGTGYDVDSERSFAQIARELNCSISTVGSRYDSAFELIVGRNRDFQTWLKLFLVMKFAVREPQARLPRLRRLPRGERSSSVRTVPETLLSNGSDGGFSLRDVAERSGQMSHDDLLDVATLMERGRTDEQIVEALELTAADLPTIAYLRSRAIASS